VASSPSTLAGSLERPVQRNQHDYEVERTQGKKKHTWAGSPRRKTASTGRTTLPTEGDHQTRGVPLPANPLDRGVRREVRDRSAHVSGEGCVAAKKKGKSGGPSPLKIKNLRPDLRSSETRSTAWWLPASWPSSTFSLPWCAPSSFWSAPVLGRAGYYALCVPSLPATRRFAMSLWI
jgi:hypothetical protein